LRGRPRPGKVIPSVAIRERRFHSCFEKSASGVFLGAAADGSLRFGAFFVPSP